MATLGTMLRQLAIIAFVAAATPVSAQEDEPATTPLTLTFDQKTPALHLPVGRRAVEIVPAFEDYAFMLYDACDAMKLSPAECSIFPMNGDLGGNAIATVLDGNRIIVYDRELSPVVGYAGAMAIMAHELGHHVCRHLGTKPDPRKELAADRYAGAAMRRSGETLEATLDMASVLDDRPSKSHPAKIDRIAALREGWTDPESAKSCALR